MALQIADRCRETTTTSGTGTISLAGAAAGFQTFVAGIGDGNTCHYLITDGNDWEVGIGTVTSGSPDTLSRDTVIASSNSGSKITLSGSEATVSVTLPGNKKAARDAIEAMPVAAIIGWPLATPPTGFLECDGSAISRTTYADLFAELGTVYGNGDGSTTFNLPDYRGEFLRGWDNSAGNDPDAASRTDRGDGTTGDNVGTKQVDAFESHTHTEKQPGGAAGDSGATHTAGSQNTNTGATGGNETRPRNVNVMWCIKY